MDRRGFLAALGLAPVLAKLGIGKAEEVAAAQPQQQKPWVHSLDWHVPKIDYDFVPFRDDLAFFGQGCHVSLRMDARDDSLWCLDNRTGKVTHYDRFGSPL